MILLPWLVPGKVTERLSVGICRGYTRVNRMGRSRTILCLVALAWLRAGATATIEAKTVFELPREVAWARSKWPRDLKGVQFQAPVDKLLDWVPPELPPLYGRSLPRTTASASNSDEAPRRRRRTGTRMKSSRERRSSSSDSSRDGRREAFACSESDSCLSVTA